MKELVRTWKTALTRPAEQDKTTIYLLLNNALGASTGLLFWLLLARVAGLAPATIGVGYALVALGTAVGLLSKGGLDTALLRHIPHASPSEARRLLRTSMLVGTAVAAGVTVAGLAFASSQAPGAHAPWLWVGAIAALLLAAWLQDAYFLAHQNARATFQRNLAFSTGKVLLPVPLVLLAVPQPVAAAWTLALGLSAAVGIALVLRCRSTGTRDVDRTAFYRSARRNVVGNTAEFLPGLILVPIVLQTQGAEAAGHFGIAWTGASLLFLIAAAVGRSALTRMVRPETDLRQVVRRAVRQATVLLAPATVLALVLARPALGLFGASYAVEARTAFVLLVASTLVVTPAYLYLALLRATEHPRALLFFPLAMVASLLLLAPVLGGRYGLEGTAMAWLLANLPFGLFAAWRLAVATKEVKEDARPQALRRRTDVERA